MNFSIKWLSQPYLFIYYNFPGTLSAFPKAKHPKIFKYSSKRFITKYVLIILTVIVRVLKNIWLEAAFSSGMAEIERIIYFLSIGNDTFSVFIGLICLYGCLNKHFFLEVLDKSFKECFNRLRISLIDWI